MFRKIISDLYFIAGYDHGYGLVCELQQWPVTDGKQEESEKLISITKSLSLKA